MNIIKKNYKNSWIAQRVTATMLLPLSFWFIYHCSLFQNQSYEEIRIFFESFFNSLLFLLMMLAILLHSKIGCETIIQDYISAKNLKIFLIRFINLIILASAIVVVVGILKLNLF